MSHTRNAHAPKLLGSLDEFGKKPDHPPMLEINVQQDEPATIVTLLGDLIGDDADRLAEKLTELASEPRARLAIDLAKTELIDSSGLGRLMECVTRSRMRGGHVVLIAPTPFVRGVLSVTKLDHWFEICDNVDDARLLLCSDD